MSGVHPTAARGFDAVPDLYERARPGYPKDAVDFMVEEMHLDEAKLVVDLGAGTGKFTRELVQRNVNVVAVEPVEGMRATFARALPDVTMFEGTAESIPLGDHEADSTVCAQAFHWFATDAALEEIGRVVRSGGYLGLVWNARDDSVDWVSRVTEIFKRYEGSDGIRIPRHRERGWRAPLERSELFEPTAERELPNSQTLTPEGLLERVSSVAFIAVLPDDEKGRALADLKELIETHPDLRSKEQIEHPYITEVYVFRRR